MNVIIGTYLIVYVLSVGVVVLGGFILHLRKSKRSVEGTKISSDDLTVLIPFRNEVERLDSLLMSISNAKKHPSKYIFLDDHSDDGSSELIRKKLVNIPFEIRIMPEEITGKKRALREGIKRSETVYVLTFDADVSFHEHFFLSLEELEEADMYVLPAILIGRSPIELVYELDVALANALNAGLSGIARPIFSSGANFLFKRDAFYESDDLASHEHMASGDDTYLLRDFRRKKKDIRLESSLDVAIHTETPHSFKAFIDQRLRWVGKTTDIGDPLATLSATGQFALAIVFFALLIATGVTGDWFGFTLILTAKIGLDLLFFLPFFHRTNRLNTWMMIPLYELVFPFYSILIGVLMLTYQPKWKGRSIRKVK